MAAIVPRIRVHSMAMNVYIQIPSPETRKRFTGSIRASLAQVRNY
ncbi:hypothetical protein GCM10023096_29980 [Nonomuraea ferruginea]